jgi:hypothetical protein
LLHKGMLLPEDFQRRKHIQQRDNHAACKIGGVVL